MSLSNSAASDPDGWPVVPQTTNGELSNRTDSDQTRGRIICVLGMHRSGASVATRLMNLLGVDLGAAEHLLGPRPDSPNGFRKYEPILDLNDEILTRLGGNWHEPPPMPPGWETTAELADLRQRARDLVARTFASPNWGWKDPRTCLTLPFWRQILPPVRFVICVRSPAEVAASLENREGFPFEKSIRLWQLYTGAAIEQTAGLPRYFFFYEDVIRSYRDEVARLARFVGRPDALDQPAVAAAIEEFIDPDFYRCRTSLINTLDNPNVLFPAKALYFAVRIAARSGGVSQEFSGIPGRDAAGEQVWPIFSRSARRAQEDRDEMSCDRAGLESRIVEISAEAQQLRTQLADLVMQAAARDAEHSAIRDRSRGLEADNRRLAEELDRAEVLVRELRARLEERDAVVTSLGSRLLERLATRDFGEMGHRLEARMAEFGGLATGSAQIESREDGREVAILQIRDQLSARQDEIRAMVSRLAETVDYLGMVRRVRADMHRLLPPGARVMVISKGDPDLLDVEGQDAWHFPQDDRGDYAGHYPAESGEAIAHLEALRARGGRFLVIPSSASWWLEHYAGLANHLDAHYRRIWKSPDCLIFELDTPGRSPQTETGAPNLPVAATQGPPAPGPGTILAICDQPGAEPLSVGPGHLRVRGWALSMAGIEGVSVLIDGHLREGVAYGSARFDVEAAHPRFPNGHHSGFVGKIDLEGLAEGEHSLVVRVRDRDGCEVELHRSFRIDAHSRPDRGDMNSEYPAWLARRTPSESDLARMRIAGMNLPYQPVISLIVPVYNTPEKYLVLMAESVMAQTYARWELCMADGGSTAPHVRTILTQLAEQDARVKVVHLPENRGIAAHTNAALALASGEFIGLLDSDDVLLPYALFEVVRALNEAPGTDLIYSDEDKTDDTGEEHWDPFFKPDWSPDLLLTTNYVCHFGVYRRSLVEAIGGLRSKFDGSQDYDLVLRFTERTDRIVHLPSILYSWRAIPGSTARDMMAKPYAVDAARRAIDDALRRRGVAGHVEPGFSLGQWRMRYDLLDQPAVTVVVAAGGNMKCLRPCLESVLDRSTYPNLHILVTDDSDGTAVADLCRELGSRDSRLRYRRFRLKPFNYSAVNNSAVSAVETPYVVLLNDDITVIAPDWIEAMLEHAQRPEVGVVGAKLLYPDRTVQHAGVIMGPYRNSGHAFKHFSDDDPGYFSLARSIRNCSAVTFACAMMRRSVFEEVGGLDARNLAVAYNDVDMCLRIRERGYWVIYTPYALLFHHESATRNMHSNPGEADYLERRWADVIRHDPFYNPNLTRDAEDYSLNFDAPTVAERLGVVGNALPAGRYGPNGEVAHDQAGDRPPAVSSETLIELVRTTIDLGRHIQGMEGQWRDRLDELSTQLEQQISRPSPERAARAANRDRFGGGTPEAQNREEARSDPFIGRGATVNGEHGALDPTVSSASAAAVDVPERGNGYRPRRSRYPEIRSRIRDVVNAELPTGSVVVVVSRGDDNLLQLGPRRGWHFPQTEAGVYAGCYPANSREAIDHLEEIRRKGGDYLLFPSTGFWWLGFYADFQKHLESHYPCVWSDPSCLIFQLSTRPASHDPRS
jgi:O-antigen biosynthesis protein